MRLKNKVAIVTGGARDIGRAVSVKLAAEGAKVVVNYFRQANDADETLAQIKSNGGEAIAVYGDMTNTHDVAALIDKAREAFGDEIHILVNVAGGLVARKPTAEIDDDFWDFVFDLNVKSAFKSSKAVLPFMPAGSSIINFSSLAGRDGGGPGASVYATAKGALLTYTRALAKELGPKGIRVNGVAPGMIATSFHDTFSKPEVRSNVANATPLRREGKASEVADLVCYLASDESSFVTGTNIDINGGLAFS
ncbi:3-oxoacyl-[acyl-carrier protein] reductase [Mucilaginibacter gracilis]|uniref:3-oxoacyl-[acyl-carrier protein] reductase n=1 Tax=Mucilaginibacter gracilis TaxID=423350 RepID=A0A495IVK8_9SPHI|nr:glucose 1-dehydrogenase [Mucilaginibacter gracilis]RKR80760.1 3-oxoacyl-[acyl-carrier protein] reductase [Mucilaginibacter gracilis]